MANENIKELYLLDLEKLKALLAAAPNTELLRSCRIDDHGARGTSYIAVVNDPIVTMIGVGYGPHPPTSPTRLSHVFGLHSFVTHDVSLPETFGLAVGLALDESPVHVWNHIELHIRAFARQYLDRKGS